MRASIPAGVLVLLVAAACGPGAPEPCGSANCQGCCDTSGACQAGDQTATCGASGVACSDCAGAGMCDSARKVCVAGNGGPAGDKCVAPAVIALTADSGNLSGTRAGATDDDVGSCGGAGAPEIVFFVT